MIHLKRFNESTDFKKGNNSILNDIDILSAAMFDLEDMGYRTYAYLRGSNERQPIYPEIVYRIESNKSHQSLKLSERKKQNLKINGWNLSKLGLYSFGGTQDIIDYQYILRNINNELNDIYLDIDCKIPIEKYLEIENETNDTIETLKGRISENGSIANIRVKKEVDFNHIYITIGNFKENRYKLEKVNESLEKEVIFKHKRNSNLIIMVKKGPDGRITSIVNKTGIRFPFSVGQLFQRNIETWACNNNFYINGEDTCPEKKIFGVRAKDVPQGHEWRHIFPHKFK